MSGEAADSEPVQSNGSDARTPALGLSRVWNRLRAVFSDSSDQSLRESLEDVIVQHESGRETLTPEERLMLHNLLEFGALRVDDVMVPRADIVAVDRNTPIADLLGIFRDAGHSRLPIYNETLDDPVGMIHSKDIMGWITTAAMRKPRTRKSAKAGDAAEAPARSPAKGPDMSRVDFSQTITDAKISREVLFVPPSMPAIDLLVKMQSTRIHMAVVIDEYGGTDGLVTIEDLVEEIVGDIEDEHDSSEGPMIVETEQGYDADARVSIEEFEEQISFKLLESEDEEDIDTLGGLVVSMVGRVPIRGELVRHDSGIEFEVLEGDPRRLKKLRVHLGTSGVPGDGVEDDADEDGSEQTEKPEETSRTSG